MQNYYYFPNLPHAIYFFKTMLNVFILNQNIIEDAISSNHHLLHHPSLIP